ncbi:bifunctional 2-C-methyl-D-erythritol 4-phosphate cytidylyltransferase/2-C-methyl-D-erythritol 2,4-cyclodiphosphate synthase [Salirhabdus sp. Marseille-P4669]|uniref:bifunctional 2-C-methyl-D-erythritol 4-phosphate cytidylyltransferase/2-C-methyl-D-erythritol 2,4-cyclodiphosphate synthase n=1 Tax=Salirhabdus sp. Marseille-P4669 TaxID=2042310 RepID=UPI000C7B08CC|nr:bifunctional 2-C-methyl-D-erythritol 4-phosphate cytidylyltransferase/2-C-methyl-D-erythritol 2,4-cyclodiphosphate synthase [Salirhabdus sp. Marseille-P4669]
MDNYEVVVVAAGLGKRMKLNRNKQFLHFAGKPLIIHTLNVFENDERCSNIYLVVNKLEKEEMTSLLNQHTIRKVAEVVVGGQERQQSVFNGLKACRGDGVVLIHDGARPFVEKEKVHALVDEVKNSGAAVLATRVTDTIKSTDGEVLKTLDRNLLWAAQTPQGFQYSLIVKAHELAMEEEYLGTDDASLVERMGHPIKVVEGSYNNFKLTTPEDIKKANSLFEQNENTKGGLGMRIGSGYDVHQLVEGRPCIIGGIEIPYEKGLLGHSDADVLLHTVADACLGAIGEGDIGKHFPDTDPEFKNADSKKLLAHVWNIVVEKGYKLGNIDCTIIAQAPKMAPYIGQMQKVIAKLLQAEVSQVNVKATTTEKLGFTGRKEGIAAQAVVLLEKI